MKKYGMKINFLIIVTILLQISVTFALDNSIVLESGKIKGNVIVENIDMKYLIVSAYNDNYSSDVSTVSNTYSLTINGDQTYKVNATICSESSYGFYNSCLSFKPRIVTVPKGGEIINDYVVENPGFVRFRLNISGDVYERWSFYGNAFASPPDNEITSSGFYSDSEIGQYGEFIMPVVPNNNIVISACVYIEEKKYCFNEYPDTYTDISPGEEVVVPLEVYHTVDTDMAIRGTISGNINLVGAGGSDLRHFLTVYEDRIYLETDSNPYNYTINEVRSGSYLDVLTCFDNYCNTSLAWPYQVGQSSNVVNFENIQNVNRDYLAIASEISGAISIHGSLTNLDIKYISLSMDGVENSSTYGGYADTTVFNKNGRYKLIVVPGFWTNSNISLRESVLDYERRQYIYDTSGPYVEVVDGGSTTRNLSYCTGSLVMNYKLANNGIVINPSIIGYMSKYAADGSFLSSRIESTHIISDRNPSVEIHGIEGYYKFNCFATLVDGSVAKFGTLNVDLECGVTKGTSFNAPSINMASLNGLVATTSSSIEVGGTVTDDSGIQGVVINGGSVDFASSNNSEDPNEVAFSKEIELNPGANTIRTEVTNNSGVMSFDERTVQFDTWSPTISWVLPQDSYVEGQSIPVEVTGADQGSGGTLQVFLDGTLLGETEITGNESTQIAETFIHSLNSVVVGIHSLRATVTDKAGNTTTSSRNFQVIPNSEVTGNGYIYPESAVYRANLNLSIIGNEGFIKYYYTKVRMGFNSSTITSLSVVDHTATITGTGTVNGVGGYTFTATVTEGVPDAFGLVIRKSTGVVYYSVAPVKLAAGNLTITQADTSVDTGDAP